ncbi:TIGR03668 family PPOX class F420-dependent oxidoreductase (plasmid) [Cellulomonas sp. WB94]|uniref:TIGR03668 family PPOX class F420-dependent oxidoreductase n=1 Tax=Cellulomonas sp. WB94 TaxID=2173174 RepID=UPI000D586307|nr:TIGR03668 family PPOX class F420-dependent oxidoreductase [Cellulomonas sp. WB94]PVU84374.1 TIGR03668 family PPOX class F420-dependent oxidoreductase [Cellulomonas sp. WB94]
MEPHECRRRFGLADHAYLATVNDDASPHLVPVTFALAADTIVIAVDHKPKRTTALRRLHNIARRPAVSLLVDEYASDWARLWWARADGTAALAHDGPVRDEGIERLVARYSQYRDVRPDGAVIVVSVHRWSGWSAR